MNNNFLKKKVDYFWEYDYDFGTEFLKSLFGDRYRRKYSSTGNGIYNLIDGEDGKIYELTLTEAKKMIVSDNLTTKNAYQKIIVERVIAGLPGAAVSKEKFITFPLGKGYAKIEITRKLSEPK